jgi:hypothetical protein
LKVFSKGLREMNTRWSLASTALACLLLSIQAANAEKPEEPIDNVIISAHREKLTMMRAEVVKLENAFYDEYNKLNTDPQYDIQCLIEARTGTLIKKRVCRPVFVNTATAEEARGFLTGDPVPPANMVINDKWADYEKHALAVINKNPKLLKMIKEREAAAKRYETARRKKLKGKLFVWD